MMARMLSAARKQVQAKSATGPNGQRRSSLGAPFGILLETERIPSLWLPVMLLLAFSVGSCIVSDEEYCRIKEDCAQLTNSSNFEYMCHPSRHVCVPFGPDSCFQNSDCHSASASRCNSNNRCEPCLPGDPFDTSCAHLGDQPFCISNAQGSGECVACLQNLDCPESAPICDNHRCRKCQRHSDCEGLVRCAQGAPCTDSLVCINDDDFGSVIGGRCAQNGASPAGRVVYVNADPAAGCDDTGGRSGTEVGQPFCSLDAAFAESVARARTYIRVLAAADYLALHDPVKAGQMAVFIGAPVPTRNINRAARILVRSRPFEVSETGSLTLDEFDFFEDTFNASVVRCTGTPPSNVPQLTLRNSILRGHTQQTDPQGAAAVDLTNCNAKIHGNVIGMAGMSHSRGLRILADPSFLNTGFVIENNIIAENWDMAADLDDVGRPVVTFRFNTLVKNGLRGTFGGIRCPSSTATVSIGYSILSGNTQPGQSQFVSPGQCIFKQVVVGKDEPLADPELIKKSPELNSAFLLDATPANTDCCIDKAQPAASETFPTTDVAGKPRPQGKSWDLGAYELPAGM